MRLEVMSPGSFTALASGMRFRFALAACLWPALVVAQATATVSADDPVYRDLDRLFGNGLVKTMLVGQRPYTRREIARIVLDAKSHASGEGVTPADQARIARLSTRFAPEIAALR